MDLILLKISRYQLITILFMIAGCVTGPQYEGGYLYGRMHGYGNLTDVNGRVYKGDFEFGQRHGYGVISLPDGTKYEGEWYEDRMHGQGNFIGADGSSYDGEFMSGRMHGQGTLRHSNGEIYQGKFRYGKKHGLGTYRFSNGQIREGEWKNDVFIHAQKVAPNIITPKKPNAPPSGKIKKSTSSGSGFFVSRNGHVVTNAHVVQGCRSVTVGDGARRQSPAEIISTDKTNDLALLKLSSLGAASAESKASVQKLGVNLVPFAASGLLRFDDVELGEEVMVAGYPYGDIFSNALKVTGGMVSAVRGMQDDTGQFQIDAAVQPGNSGGPIYDENGNIVGVVVARLNKLVLAEVMGSLPENVNFGIKASAVREFLVSSGLLLKQGKRGKVMPTKELATVAKKQTLMVVCKPE